MKKVKIGFLPLYVKLYDDGAPNMRLRINAFAEEVIELFKTRDDVEVIAADICRLENEFRDAIKLFEEIFKKIFHTAIKLCTLRIAGALLISAVPPEEHFVFPFQHFKIRSVAFKASRMIDRICFSGFVRR